MFDGKIASTMKRTENEKHFGIQIDSLCDLVSFGVLPAIIGYSICGCSWHMFAVTAAYILAGVIRLAYFNVDELQRQGESCGGRKLYEGLPITSAALIFPIVYAFERLLGGTLSTVYEVIMALVAIAFISKIKIKKPGIAGMIALLVIGTATILAIMLLR